MGALKNRSLIAGRMHLPKKTWLSDLGGDKTPVNTVYWHIWGYMSVSWGGVAMFDAHFIVMSKSTLRAWMDQTTLWPLRTAAITPFLMFGHGCSFQRGKQRILACIQNYQQSKWPQVLIVSFLCIMSVCLLAELHRISRLSKSVMPWSCAS